MPFVKLDGNGDVTGWYKRQQPDTPTFLADDDPKMVAWRAKQEAANTPTPRVNLPDASGNSIPALRNEVNAIMVALRDQGILES